MPSSTRPSPAFSLVLAFCAGLLAVPPAPSYAEDEAPAPAEPPCATPEFRQLDFWVGTWDLEWEGGSGTNVVTREYGDCVIREDFAGGAFLGGSVSTWDGRAGVWRQTWVDNAGSFLVFEGGERPDGTFVLSRAAERDGQPVLQRMVFRDIEADALTWDWESSKDDGETWQLLWRIRYLRLS